MTRGSLVTVALQGSYGKPRRALVIQSDLFDQHPSVTVLPVTTDLRDAPLFRVTVEPDSNNGLMATSQIMVDKPHTIPREKMGRTVGRISDETMLEVNRSLMVFLGLA
ncbi:MAG: type II toxin-antitoxin system PemK/MazF family toxin [Gammaproteobacteria bacterium]|nr:MAG: type II toxin-antitoxin system PemK/MazF family toxin [Gammaproteobacteria bacterium]